MAEKIRHSGIIEAVEGGYVKVRISQTSACDLCSLSKRCNISEGKERTTEIKVDDFARYAVGDSVILTAETSMLHRAVLYGFGLPLMLLVAVLLVALLITDDEMTSTAAALCSLIPYYAFLYMTKDRTRDKFSFQISKE